MARRAVLLALFVAMTAAASYAVWRASVQDGLRYLHDRGAADLRLASDRLVNALVQFREVAVLTADHQEMRNLAERGAGQRAEVNEVLQRIADRSGALELLLVAPDGTVLAGPAAAPARLAISPELARARHGATGTFHYVEPASLRRFHYVDPASLRRIFSFAAPVFGDNAQVVGALVLRVDAERVEAPGRGDPVPVWFTDAAGVAFVANRSEMVFRWMDTAQPRNTAIYPQAVPLHEREFVPRRIAGWELATGGSYLPEIGLQVARDLPVIGMTGHALIDAGAVLRAARVQALAVAAGLLGIGAVIYALWERRRLLAQRLAVEAQANAALEARVAARTAELLEANDRLTRAQAELVQAGKLSALGQMSAGISHELNQPLMAIRSYAENAALFLDRGRGPEAAENLSRISELARRMGRIIKNLRAFARQESEPVHDVDMVAVIAAALDLVDAKMTQHGVSIDWTPPDHPVHVRGGEVRLQQVMVNLLSNAADAMVESPERRLTIRLVGSDDRVRLTVADTGPGITEPERLFDPFYSTKAVGSAEGMGLGLSISYGLVQSFGGAISGANRPEGGAIFTVELDAAGKGRQAA